MEIPFEAFIDKSNQVTTVDELVALFLKTTSQHGLDRMIFCLQTDHADIGLKAGVGIIQNYPEDWMKFYFEKRFDQIDPVISYAQNTAELFSWDDIPKKLTLSRTQAQCLNMGVEAGLHHGICVPIWGPGKFAGVGLASSEREDAFDGKRDLISAYCSQFYIMFTRLHKKQPIEDEKRNIFFTLKEREVLLWASMNKTDQEIAMILGMSPHTVDYHMRNIFKKLEVNGRILAIVKAISLGLINP